MSLLYLAQKMWLEVWVSVWVCVCVCVCAHVHVCACMRQSFQFSPHPLQFKEKDYQQRLLCSFLWHSNNMTCNQHLAQFTAVIFPTDNSGRHGNVSPRTLFVVISITPSHGMTRCQNKNNSREIVEMGSRRQKLVTVSSNYLVTSITESWKSCSEVCWNWFTPIYPIRG